MIFPTSDKQQKGEFNIEGYRVKMNSSLRKDSKKDFCFEISATDKRSYMVGWCFYTLVPLPVLSTTKRLKNRFLYAHVFCIT